MTERTPSDRVPPPQPETLDEIRAMDTAAPSFGDPVPLRQPAHPDPVTGEVPAGPGDAGREDRPVLNAGSPGSKQMSNRRLGVGLAIAAALALIVTVIAILF